MSISFEIGYLIATFFAFVVNLVVVHLCNQQARQIAARYLAYITIVSNIVVATWLGISLAPTEEIAFFWTRLRLVSIILAPVIGIILILHLLHWQAWLIFPRALLIWFFPIVNLCFALFLPNHPFFIEVWGLQRYHIINVEILEFGTFNLLSNVYSLVAVVLALLLLRSRADSTSRLINAQTAWIVAGILMVSFLSNAKSLGLLPANAPHPYPIAVIFGGLMIIHGLRLSPLRDVVPIAYELIFRNMAQSAIVLNHTNHIVDMNPTARIFFGDEMPIGRPIQDYQHLANILTDTTPSREFAIDDAFYAYDVSEVQRGERILGRVLILTDITERKRNDVARDNLLITLDAYARTVAHDLKNPVTIISGYLQLAQDLLETVPDTEKIQRYIGKAQRGNKTMNDIIQSMLVLATLRKDEMPYYRTVSMSEVLHQALERLAFDIENKSAQINLKTPFPDVFGDEQWLEEIWINYLSNALKYGGQPPIITIQAHVDEEDNGLIRYSVTDNGLGLSEKEQKTLFQSMQRLDKHHEIQGHGLGLVIVKQMVERMNGKIHLESTEGVGSTFSFSLPSA